MRRSIGIVPDRIHLGNERVINNWRLRYRWSATSLRDLNRGLLWSIRNNRRDIRLRLLREGLRWLPRIRIVKEPMRADVSTSAVVPLRRLTAESGIAVCNLKPAKRRETTASAAHAIGA